MNLFGKPKAVSSALTVRDRVVDDTSHGNLRESSLEAGLMELLKIGEPRVSFVKLLRSGWVASVDLNTDVLGMTGQIRSDWYHKTPSAAVNDLLERTAKIRGTGRT